MIYGLNIKETDSQIRKMICAELCTYINDLVNRKRLVIENRVRSFTLSTLLNCPEVLLLKDQNSLEHKNIGVSVDQLKELLTYFTNTIVCWTNNLMVTSRGLSTSPFLELRSDKLDSLPYLLTTLLLNSGKQVFLVCHINGVGR